jgi:hypothetical protein
VWAKRIRSVLERRAYSGIWRKTWCTKGAVT